MKKAGKKKQRMRNHYKPRSFINPELKKAIKAEAKILGVTQNEYVRIAIGIAKNIREGLGDEQEQDARQLLTIIQNPLFVLLLRTVADSFLHQTDIGANNQGTQGNNLFGTIMPPQNKSPAIFEFW